MNIRSRMEGAGSAGSSPLVEKKAPKGVKADTLHSIPVSRQESRRGDTRQQDRHRLPEEQVAIRHNGRDHAVQLINLSGGGAMVAGDFAPNLWDRVELRIGDDGVIECAVCWLKGDRIGLEFAHETRLDCSPDEQAVLLREVITRSFPDVEFEATCEAAAPKEQPADEQRSDRRHPLIWSGTLHHDFASTAVRLRNISSTGTLIECEAPPPVGSEPLLDLGEGCTVFGTVTWVVGDQAGLKFKAPFDMTQLARARPQIAPARWERPAYLQGASVTSPWSREWERMSLSELRDDLEGWLKR